MPYGNACASVALLVLAAAAVLVRPVAPRAVAAGDPGQRPQPPAAAASADELRAQCGTCHVVPPPDVLPASRWRDTIARMVLIRDGRPEPVGPPGTAARMVVLSPELQRVARYYTDAAPERLPAPAPWPDVDAGGFRVHAFAPEGGVGLPAISHVRLLDLDADGRGEIVAADMRHGLIVSGDWREGGDTLRPLARLENPSHLQMVDLDGDRARDLLVADLGSFQPANHQDGAVVWLRNRGRDGFAAARLTGWPRVAGVEAGDLNGDGKSDLAVAAFGWRTVGRLSVLENRTADYAQPTFTEHVVDPRTGSIDAVPVDLNGDGRLDLVGLLAQEHETVVAYLNTGTGFTFRQETIYAAPHPNWGSSGIQVIDLDIDGDLDVLLTHGDTFDDQLLKPYHGIIWLENRGTFPFTQRRLADLPGALRAQAGDLDGDGDLDVVAAAFLSGEIRPSDQAGTPSLVWLEQTARGEFSRRTLERRVPRHATLDLGDIDGDGDLDVLVGNFLLGGETAQWVEVWENRRVTKP